MLYEIIRSYLSTSSICILTTHYYVIHSSGIEKHLKNRSRAAAALVFYLILLKQRRRPPARAVSPMLRYRRSKQAAVVVKSGVQRRSSKQTLDPSTGYKMMVIQHVSITYDIISLYANRSGNFVRTTAGV